MTAINFSLISGSNNSSNYCSTYVAVNPLSNGTALFSPSYVPQNTTNQPLNYTYFNKGKMLNASFPNFSSFVLPPNYNFLNTGTPFIYKNMPCYALNYSTNFVVNSSWANSFALYSSPNNLLEQTGGYYNGGQPYFSFLLGSKWYMAPEGSTEFLSFDPLTFFTPSNTFPWNQISLSYSGAYSTDGNNCYATSPGYGIYKYSLPNFSLLGTVANPVSNYVSGCAYGKMMLLIDSTYIYMVDPSTGIILKTFDVSGVTGTFKTINIDENGYLYLQTYDSGTSTYSVFTSDYFVPVLTNLIKNVRNFTPTGHYWPRHSGRYAR